MAFAQRIITSNSAGDQDFTFNFDYIKEEHIKVFVNFVEKAQGTGSNEFQVITNTTPKKISLNTGLAADNTRVEIRRVSSLSTPLVDFEDGSTLTAADLDTAEKQSLFIDQELDDALKQGISIDPNTGLPSLSNQRLSNVLDPVNAQDVVTKAYLERSGSITSTQIADGTIVNGDIANATITGAKLVNDTVTATQIAANAVGASELANNAVDANALQDGSVTSAKIANDQINSQHYVDQSIDEVHLNNNIIGSAKIIDGAVISTKISNNGVTNAKLADNSVTNTKIANDSVTNTKIADDSIDSEHYVDGSIDEAHLNNNIIGSAKIIDGAVITAKVGIGAVNADRLASNSVTNAKIANNAVTTDKIADAELTTLAGMQSGTASKLADSTALTADIADLNQLDGMAKETSITNSNTKFPTSAAVVNFVANQIAPVGGLEVIANEDSFPPTQPVSGVVISISNADGLDINNAGEASNARTLGNSVDNVTIKNFPASLRNKVLANELGLLVSSTGASQEYNYHKLLAKETDVLQLSDDINDFNSRYRVENTLPAANDSSNHDGDLVYAKDVGKIYVYSGDYNGTPVGSFGEVQSIGNFFISTLSPAFNGSLQDFTITNAPSNAEQIILSIGGVIQKPNAGSSTPSEGFALSGNTIKLAAAPPSGTDYFAIVLGSTVNIGTPSNDTVTSAILQNGSVIEAKLGSGAVTRTKLNLVSTSSAPGLEVKGDGSSDGYLQLNCSQNSHGIKLKSPPHSASQSYTLTFPSNIVSGQFLTTDANGNLSWAAVVTDLVNDTSPQLGGTLQTNGNNIDFADTEKARFGNAADLQIYHDGNHSYIARPSGADGQLLIRALENENGIVMNANGSIELHHDDNKVFETITAGIKVQRLTATSSYIEMANSGGVAGYFYGENNNVIYLMDREGHAFLKGIKDGAVELYYDNEKQFETTGGGASVYGNGTTCHLNVYNDPSNNHFAGSLRGYNNGSGASEIGVSDANGSWAFRADSNGNSWSWRHFKPANNNTHDLGDGNYRWRNIYTNDLNLSNEGGANDVDSTWGSFTIQEGAEDLFLINRRNGKKYKFNLTEVN